MEIDREIEVLVRDGGADPAAARLLEIYGSELYGLLVQLLGEADAGEVFAQLAVPLRARLASFSFRYSTRTLLYGIARRAVRERSASPQAKAARDRVGVIRDGLDPDDRILLTLRVDRALSWEDVARVLHDVDEPDEVVTESVRKRFASVKEEVRRRAQLNSTMTAAGEAHTPRSDKIRAPKLVGHMVGGYRIHELLGGGGMGVVWLAEHVKLGRKAVIKFMQDDLADDVVNAQRFLNEAKTTASIRHPGIVEVFDFSTDERGHAYIAMELLEGESLHERLDREPRLPVDLALAITGQIAVALAAAHGAGVIHRDLKPGNVFLVPDPDSPFGVRVKVLDFGLAKATVTSAPGLTQTGVVVGTPRYMSPEQCRSKVGVDGRSDVYSLGCILFEMVCGRPPFLGKAGGELMLAHSTLPPPAPSELAPTISPALERTILRMLAKEPEQRFSSMQDLAGALAQIAGTAPPDELLATPVARPQKPSVPPPQPPHVEPPPQPPHVEPPPQPPHVEPPQPRSWRPLVLGIAVVVALALVLVLVLR